MQAVKDPVRTVVGRPAYKSVAAELLLVYPRVQRLPPSKALVKEIADKLDFSALGVIHASLRKDGTYSTMDGQRRVAALLMRGLGSFKCHCLVYEGLTEAQEAAMFLRLNDSRTVGAFDRFVIGLTAEEPSRLAIADICKKHGWKIGRTPLQGIVSCTKTMENVWEKDGDGRLLTATVSVLTEAFGRDQFTLNGHLLDGMSRFLKKDSSDRAVLIDKLRAKFATPASIVTKARARRDIERGPMAENVAAIIERTYGSRKTRI